MKQEKNYKENPLGILPVPKLLMKFAVPSIVAMLVGALYNIVDQYFIGNSVGPLGNAATNIAFPLSISCISIALLFGIGGASAFNLAMGAGEKDEAVHFMGNALTLMTAFGVILTLITELFLGKLVYFFGSPDNVAGYAMDYIRITAIGFPCLILSVGGGNLIRADGSPKMTMVCNLVGAILNTILDAIFVFELHMGIKGAALATIIGQMVSCGIAIRYLMHCKTVTLQKKHLIPYTKYATRVASLGAAPCTNQIAMMVVQIVMNKSLTYYGSLSVYGEAIPLACAGIITKVNQVFFSLIIGISQGLQPIISFNYGAGQYKRVKQAYFQAAGVCAVLSVGAFLMFQIFPKPIIGIFGDGSETYYNFAISYFRIFLFFTFLNFVQPITSNCFTAIGKPKKGMFLSLTRQILFLLPLLVILPMIIGIDGILYAGPIADGVAGIVAVSMILFELRKPQYNEDSLDR